MTDKFAFKSIGLSENVTDLFAEYPLIDRGVLMEKIIRYDFSVMRACPKNCKCDWDLTRTIVGEAASRCESEDITFEKAFDEAARKHDARLS